MAVAFSGLSFHNTMNDQGKTVREGAMGYTEYPWFDFLSSKPTRLSLHQIVRIGIFRKFPAGNSGH